MGTTYKGIYEPAIGETGWGTLVNANWTLLADRTLTVIKAVDESVTSSTTLQDDNELFVAVAANEVWRVKADILLDNNSVTGPALKFGVSVPSGTVRWGDATYFSGAIPTSLLTESQTTNVDPQARASGLVEVRFYYTVTIGGTAGNFRVRWAQAVSTATASFVRKYSQLECTKLA